MKTTSPKPTKKQKIDLTAILESSTDGKSEYPVLPDPDGKLARLVDRISTGSEELDQLKGELETAKADLTQAARLFYFKHLNGLTDIPSSILAHGVERNALVTFKNQYKAVSDETALEGLMGKAYDEFVYQDFDLKIDGDKIPSESKQALIQDLVKLFARHNAKDALTAKQAMKPTAEFHTRRHTLFDTQKNVAIDKFTPIVTAVKTKNVKG